MNQAHLHMVLNHFPIIGLIFGIGVLIYGIIKKHTILVNTAYVIFIICMILCKATMITGEGAEEIAEELGISNEIIHEHEEIAENFMKVLYGLGILSILGLVANIKKHTKAFVLSLLILILAIGSSILSIKVGNSGGEIRHTEIREKTSKDNTSGANHEEESQSDND
jgi:uncharacterized membrane protein